MKNIITNKKLLNDAGAFADQNGMYHIIINEVISIPTEQLSVSKKELISIILRVTSRFDGERAVKVMKQRLGVK